MVDKKTERISVTLCADVVAFIDRATEEGKFTRSDVLTECIRAAREQTKLFGQLVFKLGTNGLEKGERKKVLLSLSPDDLTWLDEIAEKAAISRSEMVSTLCSVIHRETRLLNRLGLTAIRRRRMARAMGVDVPHDIEPDSEDESLTGEECEA